MAKHVITCRVCKEKFDITPLIEGVDWVMPSKNFYYHKRCYDSWKSKTNDVRTQGLTDEEWKNAAYDYLRKDLRIPLDWGKFNSQWNSLLKKKRTAKGIYFCIRYFYEIEKGDKTKAQGGIGIVDYVYNRSAQYWQERENRSEGIVAKIEQQIQERIDRENITIHRTNKQRRKKISLEMVEEINDSR